MKTSISYVSTWCFETHLRQEHWSNSAASKDRSSQNERVFVLVEKKQQKTEAYPLLCHVFGTSVASSCTNKFYPFLVCDTEECTSFSNTLQWWLISQWQSLVEWIKPFFFIFLHLTGIKITMFSYNKGTYHKTRKMQHLF